MKKILFALVAMVTTLTAQAQENMYIWQGGVPTKVETADSLSLTTPESREFDVKGVKFKMIYVQGGTFNMGAQSTDPNGLEYYNEEKLKGSESPVHKVTVSSFFMQETECRQDLWLALFPTYSWFETKGPDYPCNGQMYSEMLVFIDSLNNYLAHTGQISPNEKFSIPTEAQWEWAAKGGVKSKGYRHPGGDNIDEIAWNMNNSDFKLHKVAQKKPNELGFYDMAGNCFEACSDHLSWKYDWWTDDQQWNPQGTNAPIDQNFLVDRGGGWAHPAWRMTVTKRDRYDIGSDTMEGAAGDQGFRMVLQ